MTLQELSRSQKAAGEVVSRKVAKNMDRFAGLILAEMKIKVPVDTGNLRDHLRIKVLADRWEIGPEGVDYAMAVEHGSKPHTIRAKNGGTMAFQIGGRTVYAKSVRHPGNRAQPYIRPAYEKYVKELSKNIALDGAKYWEKT